MKKLISKINKELQIRVNDKPVKEVIKKLENELKKRDFDVIVELGGSFAKKTYLSNDFDVDVFVRFKTDKDISNKLEITIKNITKKYLRVHGSRDYFQLKYKKMLFEIVPVFYIQNVNEAHNITDCSPLHVHWIKKQIKKNPKLVDEIKIGKLFLKANKLYGAESYLNSFSGHVLDILIVYYGSFEKFIKKARNWNEKVLIDINKNYKTQKELLNSINKSKRFGPLIVVDPIDKTRNAAAALGNEKFKKFIKLCNEFYKNPSEAFFKVKNLNEKELKKPYLKIVLAPIKGKSTDVIGTKAFKLIKYFKQLLKNNNYSSEIIFDWDKKKDIFAYLLLNKKELTEKYFVRSGPPIKQKKDVKNFKEKHPNYYIYNKKLYVKERKKGILKIIKKLENNDYQKDKVKKIKKIKVIK